MYGFRTILPSRMTNLPKYALGFLLSLLLPLGAAAQYLEFTPQVGYLLSGSTLLDDGTRLDIGNGTVYGGQLSAELSEGIVVFFEFQHLESKARIQNGPILDREVGAVGSNYLHFGSQREFWVSDRVAPFFGASIGAMQTINKARDLNEWFFLSSAFIGVKWMLSSRVGIKAQARMMMPMKFQGVGLWCDPFFGCDVGLIGYARIIQGDFSGGMVIRLAGNR